jgi:hypothetical protein
MGVDGRGSFILIETQQFALRDGGFVGIWRWRQALSAVWHFLMVHARGPQPTIMRSRNSIIKFPAFAPEAPRFSLKVYLLQRQYLYPSTSSFSLYVGLCTERVAMTTTNDIILVRTE